MTKPPPPPSNPPRTPPPPAGPSTPPPPAGPKTKGADVTDIPARERSGLAVAVIIGFSVFVAPLVGTIIVALTVLS